MEPRLKSKQKKHSSSRLLHLLSISLPPQFFRSPRQQNSPQKKKHTRRRKTMIPYATIEEASMALGRNLTYFETKWFDYSATKSDYYLYCHNILFLFLIFSLVPLPLVFIELTRSTSDLFDRFKIQPKVKYSFSDMFRCYKDVMKMFLLVVGPLQLVSYPSIQV